MSGEPQRHPVRAAAEPGFRGDAHVHLYPAFDTHRFLTTALERASTGPGSPDTPFVLFFTESRGHDAFRHLRDQAASGKTWTGNGPPITLRPVAESTSLQVVDTRRPGAAPVYLVAGRQVVSREGLEVLILAVPPEHDVAGLPDRSLSAAEIIEQGLASEAAAGLPWGLGKWLGARGREVGRLVAAPGLAASPRFFVGDIAARCRPWPRPAAFRGRTVLPGTDLLPVAGAEVGLGSYGFEMQASFDVTRPAASFLSALENGRPSLSIGHRQSPVAVILDQIRWRVGKSRRSAERES